MRISDHAPRSVSVVIVNFNGAHTLARCLAAVVGQPRVREVILVDNASSDSSLTVAQRFPVVIVPLDENSGPAHARNVGAGRATGEHLLFLDSGVAVSPAYASTLADFLDAHPVVGVAGGSAAGTKPFSVGSSDPRRVDWVPERAMMTSRLLFETLGGFDERRQLLPVGSNYCRRARAAGREVWCVPAALAADLGSQAPR